MVWYLIMHASIYCNWEFFFNNWLRELRCPFSQNLELVFLVFFISSQFKFIEFLYIIDEAPNIDETIKQANIEIQAENRNLQALNTSLHEKYHTISLKVILIFLYYPFSHCPILRCVITLKKLVQRYFLINYKFFIF